MPANRSSKSNLEALVKRFAPFQHRENFLCPLLLRLRSFCNLQAVRDRITIHFVQRLKKLQRLLIFPQQRQKIFGNRLSAGRIVRRVPSSIRFRRRNRRVARGVHSPRINQPRHMPRIYF